MKTRQTISLPSILIVALTVALSPAVAVAEAPASITGAGAAAFPSGTTFSGVALSAMRFGMAVDIVGDGTASGGFQSTLLGAQRRQLLVEGTIVAGSVAADGTSTFSGLCSVNAGDGTAAVSGVPFHVTVGKASDGKSALTLVVGGTALPAAAVTAGTVSTR